jgi:methionine-rich copper-binding protein CopC
MPGHVRRTLLAALIVAAASLLAASPAAAHGQLAESVPADGGSVDKPPAHISLFFTEPPALDASFQIKAPDGSRVDAGWEYGEVKRLREPVQELFLEDGNWVPKFYDDGYAVNVAVSHLPSKGDYTVSYATVASDGDEVNGTMRFSYKGAPTKPEPGAAPLPAPSVRPPLPATGPRSANEQNGAVSTPGPVSSAPSSTTRASNRALAPASADTGEGGSGVLPWVLTAVALVAIIGAYAGLRVQLRRRAAAAVPAGPAPRRTPKGSASKVRPARSPATAKKTQRASAHPRARKR